MQVSLHITRKLRGEIRIQVRHLPNSCPKTFRLFGRCTASTLRYMHPVTPAGVLAGRDDELVLLNGLLRDLAQGSGNAVLIEGEPGIGKTALVRAALSATVYGLPLHAGAHYNGSSTACQ